jgi:hypothetical protein
MAATKTLGRRAVPGDATYQSIAFTGDAAYPTGGYVVLPSDFGFQVLRRIIGVFMTTIAGAAFEVAVVPTVNADGITLAQVNLALVVGTTGAQVANGVDVHTVGIHIIGEGN